MIIAIFNHALLLIYIVIVKQSRYVFLKTIEVCNLLY